MRLTKSTDDALRVLLYAAARPARRVSTEEISTAFGVWRHDLGEAVEKPGRAGWLERGRSAELTLACDAADTRPGDVVRSAEPALHLADALPRDARPASSQLPGG